MRIRIQSENLSKALAEEAKKQNLSPSALAAKIIAQHLKATNNK